MGQFKALSVAIVGGGPGCKAIMDMIFAEKLSQLRMMLVGVASRNTEAEGYRFARERGIYATADYRNLFRFKDLDMIIELTGDQNLTYEICRTKPKHVHLMDHVAARLFWDVFQIEEKRISERKEAQRQLQESEEKCRLLNENIPVAVYSALPDEHSTNLFISGRMEELTGYPAEAFLKNPRLFAGTVHPEDRDYVWDKIEEHRRKKEGLDIAYRIITKNGSIKWVRDKATPVFDRNREIVRLDGFMEDITERKQAEDALRESEEKYRNLVERAHDAIVIIQGGALVYVNKRTAEITGYSVEELTGGQFADYVAPNELERVTQYHSKRMAGESVPSRYQSALRHRDGSRIDVEFSAAVITYRQEPAALAIIRDITERKQAIEEKKKLEAQLQQAQKMESIGTLAGGIAHDFNNLLMGIQGNVSLMLLDMEAAHPFYERLKNVEKQIQSGARLTSYLLGYARKGKYEVKPADLNRLVRDACETFGRTKKNIRVYLKLSEDLLAVEVDEDQIEQVFFNLCVNAADAMPDGGDITVRTLNTTHDGMQGKLYKPKPGKYVLLTVTDSGTGMDQETLKRVFEPFFTTKERGRGTGLGLASAYGIAKAHGGYIDVRSAVGRGSTFSLYLPASDRAVAKPPGYPAQPAGGTETVLLVDDEEGIRQVGREMLEAMGYKVLSASDGQQALGIYKKNRDRIDLVLLDMVMPNMGGAETYDGLKKIHPEVKVLLLSGYSLKSQATEILECGCNGFIQKPFDMKELSARIRQILDKS